MLSLFGNPEPADDSSSESSGEVLPPEEQPPVLRRLAEMLEQDAAAREQQEAGAIQELEKLTTRVRADAIAATVPAAPAGGSPPSDTSTTWVHSRSVLR